jgi:acyl-CoA synthetase (AMP-forming)/AMP-acid ligase II
MKPNSIVDVLQRRAKNQPHELAFRFISDGEQDDTLLTYENLDRRACSIAASLQSSLKHGDRAVLLFPPGLDFVAAFFGCLYAKVIAVPAYPPHPARIEVTLPIILGLIADADASAVLLSKELYTSINSRNTIKTALDNIKLIVIDDGVSMLNYQWHQAEIKSDDIAYLQYTSGSTSAPKGVMISHNNLIHNMHLIQKCFGISKEDHGVIWLPPYHDMGLIGGILQPLYSGVSFTLMPHLMFLQRPLRWLETISRFRATISGAPDFAYELSIKKIKSEQREQLDLSSWRVAFNGAEPVYHKTLNQFANYFAPCGFRKEAFMPCYGLAESTLLVSASSKGSEPLMKRFLNNALERNHAIISHEQSEDAHTLVSCGKVNTEQKVKIVNPETMIACSHDEIGEIWVRGNSVATGYWNKQLETACTFNAKPADNDKETFLRTGDFGFLHEGELYITGRLKNLIISEGKNHYPQDIEKTIEACHSAIRSRSCAVFSIQNNGHEEIIAVAETEHTSPLEEVEICKVIREAVSVNHGLYLKDIKLTKPGSIPKTTSGKTKHFACKQYYLEGNLIQVETI